MKQEPIPPLNTAKLRAVELRLQAISDRLTEQQEAEELAAEPIEVQQEWRALKDSQRPTTNPPEWQAAPPHPPKVWPGLNNVIKRYHVFEEIGKGAWATVYRAKDE